MKWIQLNYIKTEPNKHHQSWNCRLHYQTDTLLIFIHAVRSIILQHFHLNNKLIIALEKAAWDWCQTYVSYSFIWAT